MIKQIILIELIKQFKGTKFEESNNIATMFAQCLHIKDSKIINLISISITMGVLRYNKFDYTIVNL